MKKLSKIASVLAITFVGVCLVACQQPTTENSNGLATLPGTVGGSTNSKDIFQGKTFYNNAEESKAYGKYVFRTDGTYTYYGRNISTSGGEVVQGEWVAQNEFKYSLSSDGNTMYQMLNRTRASSTDSELKTYQELLNDESFKEFMEEGVWNSLSDDEKKKLLSEYGLSSTATFEQFYQAALKSLFSVREYKITNEGKSCIRLTPASVDGSEYSIFKDLIFLYSTNTN